MVDKSGGFDWRKLQLIHPFSYVCLLRVMEIHWDEIKERFAKFKTDTIVPAAIPIVPSDNENYTKATILNWREKVENFSISLSLEYSCLAITDITDCYNSVYTHAVAWALHDKEFVKERLLESQKERKKEKLFGESIDKFLRYMHYGQTNGIPAGSVLMDFIAELVLGYADLELSKRIKTYDCKIIRYRDDYRIFAKSSADARMILKILSETLSDFGFKLNGQKTLVTTDLINGAFKKDKRAVILSPLQAKNLQKQLLLIYNFGQKFPNSGQIVKLLSKYRKRLSRDKKPISNHEITRLIAIVVNIMNEHSKTYPVCMTIISFLADRCLSEKQREDAVKKIKDRLSDETCFRPNSELLEVWIQRLTIKWERQLSYTSKLCKLVTDENNVSEVFDISWLPKKIQDIFRKISVIDRDILEKMPPVISGNETDDFCEY